MMVVVCSSGIRPKDLVASRLSSRGKGSKLRVFDEFDPARWGSAWFYNRSKL